MAGFLEQNPENSKYYLGTALLQLSRLVMNRMNIIRDAHPYLVKLSARLGNRRPCGAKGYNAMFADKVKGTSIANMGSSIGVTIPAHGTASGKVLLSYKSDEEIEDYLLHVKLEQYTLHSLTRPEQVREAIANARINGYAEDLEETEEGLRCPRGFPSSTSMGNPAGSISISGASSRMERNWSVYLEEIRAAAAEISQKLGYRQP